MEGDWGRKLISYFSFSDRKMNGAELNWSVFWGQKFFLNFSSQRTANVSEPGLAKENHKRHLTYIEVWLSFHEVLYSGIYFFFFLFRGNSKKLYFHHPKWNWNFFTHWYYTVFMKLLIREQCWFQNKLYNPPKRYNPPMFPMHNFFFHTMEWHLAIKQRFPSSNDFHLRK